MRTTMLSGIIGSNKYMFNGLKCAQYRHCTNACQYFKNSAAGT